MIGDDRRFGQTGAVALVSRWRAVRERGHRGYAVVTGERGWCRSWATAMAPAMAPHAVLWVGEEVPARVDCLRAAMARQVLGREYAMVVFDAYCGFDPDAFGAVTGTLRGGGLLLLLAPPLELWPAFKDPDYRRLAVAPYGADRVSGRFLSRLVEVIRQDRQICIIRQEDGCAPVDARLEGLAGPVGPTQFRPSDDQQNAIAAIIKVATGHRRRPLVLTSDRGRGKSAAMGLAAARLLEEGAGRTIVVTAPRAAAVAVLFEHCRRQLPAAGGSNGVVTTACGAMRFVAPDELVKTAPPAHLLLVDEAAAIPTPLLEQLLARYARVAFATTVHGYEGTGRGFAVRFQRVLNERAPGWRHLRLQMPIRWARDDPLERFVFEGLMLNASAAPAERLGGFRLSACEVTRLDRDELVADATGLSELFGLLVLAHYRSRPFDLRLLLDAPNVDVYAVRFEGHVVATVLAAVEGGFGEEDAAAIFQGRLRPHGNPLPETLAAHGGSALAPSLRYLRIMRIAVHPALQRRGIGRRLVEAVMTQAVNEGYDAVGVSFGATLDVLGFWAACGLTLLRVGLTRDHSSGTHSAVMLRPLSVNAGQVVAMVRRRLAANLPHQLLEPLRDMDPLLVVELFRHSAVVERLALTPDDERDLHSFACGWCGYELVAASLWKFTQWAVGDTRAWGRLDDGGQRLLVLKVLQKQGWREVVSALGYSGRGAALAAVRQAIHCLLAAYRE